MTKVWVKGTDAAMRVIHMLDSASVIEEALEKYINDGMRAPGLALAKALVEAEIAKLRSTLSFRALQSVAAAGYDIQNVSDVVSEMRDGRLGFSITMSDLIDRAESRS